MKDADIELIYQFNSSLETLKYVCRDLYTDLNQAKNRYEEFKKHYLEQKAIWWVIEQKTDQLKLGYCGLFNMAHGPKSAEIGYGILKPFWRKGIASETITALISYGIHSLELHRIHASITPENLGSIKALVNNGFTLEGQLKDVDFARNQYFDRLIYAYLNVS